jgi:glycosyltransferase involved in cell wall biosynthesis
MGARPRVLLLVTLAEWGGAQHIVSLLAHCFHERYALSVACAPRGELVTRLLDQGIRVVSIPEFVRNPHPWRDAVALWRLFRVMRRERFDLVHAHGTKAGLLGRLAARIARVPVVLFTAHGWAFTEGRAIWQRWLLASVERLAARWSTRIVCVSAHDWRLAQQFGVGGQTQLVVIRNGIKPVDPPRLDADAVRRTLGVRELPVIVSVGRLASQKDPMTLLDAARRLAAGTVVLVGDGPLRPTAERYVRRHGLQDRVILAGMRRDVASILAVSDVFVLASRWEGLPLAIIEAMMAGLPVVATRVGGVPELVEDGVTGVIVPPRDSEALAAALRRLLADPGLRSRMGRAGKERAFRDFTEDRMARETEKLYEELLAVR